MPTTYTPGYGGTLTVNGAALPVQNVTIDLSRAEMDVTATTDNYTLAMSGRITRRVSCTALVTSATESLITAVMNTAAGTQVALSWADGNGVTTSIAKVMCVSASRSSDNQGAATVAFQFAESV
jgi:hypothetical protein